MKKEIWHDQYPKGIPTEINADAYSSLIDLLNVSFEKYKGLTAYHNMGKDLSFEEVDQLSTNFAAYLQSIGMKKGDRIALMMPNVLQNPIAIFGSMKAGLTIVNTNPLYTARELEHQLVDSGATTIVILANFAHVLEKALPKTNVKNIVVTELGDLLGGLKGALVNFVVKKVKKMVPAYSLPVYTTYKDALKIGSKKTYTAPKMDREDIAFLQYTGGTTGTAKGAMLTHRNLIANMEQIRAWMIPKLEEYVEICITALPLYHIFALTVNCLTMLKIGAKSVLITNPRDMPAFIKELKNHKFSIITGVNTLFNGLLNQADFKTINFSPLKVSVGGGMAVQVSTAEKWKSVTGCTISEGYGLTESSPVLTCNPIDGTEQIGSIGIPVPSTEIRLVDDDGKDVAQGERGEIWGRGPQVMKGYWQREEATKEVLTEDGWLKTGDVGVMEKDGFFKIVDRKKEMILVSGFNVYPSEVEAVISSHPKVLECGVTGVPDDKSNEAVAAFIIKSDQSLTEDEIREYCKKELTGYKVPKIYHFRDELPKSNVGKILRRLLK